MLQHAWWGERARMGKMRLHGPWEIPPLFAITVTFQHSKVFVIPAEESSNFLITGEKSDLREVQKKYTYQRDQSALIWGVKS